MQKGENELQYKRLHAFLEYIVYTLHTPSIPVRVNTIFVLAGVNKLILEVGWGPGLKKI